ncbi:hypothetical protein EVG20_g5923 [Dentipellis fragilis]|uniref:Rab-GAP TBC domain-containing protein n=1 Tax=Dentipellis fragilis TaxID=205917 RepID=A0A4Y9YS23_9AGAM|nr:hypothetical protein EVG20_g5923 [Dentipellis fragilis]
MFGTQRKVVEVGVDAEEKPVLKDMIHMITCGCIHGSIPGASEARTAAAPPDLFARCALLYHPTLPGKLAMAESTSWTDPEDPIAIPPTTRETKTPPAPFYLDDAFSDGDENDDVLEFSSQSLRAELAKNLSPTTNEDQEDVQNIAPSIPNASVSTLDMNGHTDSSPSAPGSTLTSPPTLSPSAHHAPELVSHSPSSQFEQISLSDGPAAENPDPETPPRRHSEGSQGEGSIGAHPDILPATDDDHGVPPEHQKSPTVHPEVMSPSAPEEATQSPPPSQVIIIPPHSSSSPPSGPDTARTSSFEHHRTPSTAGHGQRAVSTPSLYIPTTPKTAPLRPSAGHKPTRSTGPSTFEKVVSRTRPSFLPPKTREEDDKHLADWEKMMKQSRIAEEKRRQALAERRLVREQKIEESLHRWEKDIMPDWKVVDKNPALRRLWWAGIPTKLRASLWERAVGNALALSKGGVTSLTSGIEYDAEVVRLEIDSYRMCLARAKRALAAGTFPTTTLSLIEEDVQTTLPSIHIFHPETGPMYEDLKEMLYAWVVARSDEGLGYTKGVAKIAAMILLNMPAVQGFIVMRNLLERQCMRAFYGGLATKDEVEAYYRIFDTLLADGMPKIYFNFKQHQISPAAYLPEWIVPLFLDHLPFEACARIWDVILLEGDAFVYRASLAILAVLEPRLFFPDRQELLELLRGQNKAALEVAKRDGRPHNGGRYEIYGVDEETLWDRIDSMDDWWKESTWTRLLQRELPDLLGLKQLWFFTDPIWLQYSVLVFAISEPRRCGAADSRIASEYGSYDIPTGPPIYKGLPATRRRTSQASLRSLLKTTTPPLHKHILTFRTLNMPFGLTVAARRPALLLFVTLESLLIAGVWSQYRRPSAILKAKPKSHIPPAKVFW